MQVSIGTLEIDFENCLLRQTQPVHHEIQLTPTEAQVLEILVTRQGNYVSQRAILDAVWKDAYAPSHYVRVYIGRIREKLRTLDTTGPVPELHGAYGIGYRLSLNPSGVRSLERAS